VIAKSHRLFSDRLSQNRQRGSSDNIRQIAKRVFSEFDRQNVIANLAIKERKIAESI
jgi:hypothetical protein